jgi:hypothetical protein
MASSQASQPLPAVLQRPGVCSGRGAASRNPPISPAPLSSPALRGSADKTSDDTTASSPLEVVVLPKNETEVRIDNCLSCWSHQPRHSQLARHDKKRLGSGCRSVKGNPDRVESWMRAAVPFGARGLWEELEKRVNQPLALSARGRDQVLCRCAVQRHEPARKQQRQIRPALRD